jgi:hypothetical protein
MVQAIVATCGKTCGSSSQPTLTLPTEENRVAAGRGNGEARDPSSAIRTGPAIFC